MFQRILIANRGEIAVRIIRACKALDIESVAVYSTADTDALHAQLADEAVCVGGPSSGDSYLNMENLLSAAIHTGAEAIHPGYGFLSENSRFAKLCQSCNIAFIGPSADTIAKMGDKSQAKKLMKEAGVPLVPGSAAEVSLDEGKELVRSIGVPVLIKASAGGGGRGMRIVRNEEDFESAFRAARQEAEAAFGHGGVYIEKLIENPRHIEVQILADKYGNIVHLGERDCSIQRRNQKIVEEAPSSIDDDMKASLFDSACKAAEHVGYENAGTVEFIVDEDGFYFIEMNTRLQVEHPVTEMISGIDIVKEQIRIASESPLSITQEDISFDGHAIEVRINAEDPMHDFRPSPSRIDLLHIPQGPGVRFDSMAYTDYLIPPHYDSLIGKLIVHGRDRPDAILKLRAALDEIIIEGVKTNQTFLMMIALSQPFRENDIDTSFIRTHLKRLLSYAS